MPPVWASAVESTELMSTCWGTPETPAAVEVVTMRLPFAAAETMGREEMGRPPVVIVWRALCKKKRKVMVKYMLGVLFQLEAES